MTQWTWITLQNACSTVGEQLMMFHSDCMVVLVCIAAAVGYLMTKILTSPLSSRFDFEGQAIEFIWTALPATILIFVAFPSLHLLYMLDDSKKADLTLKAIGHQWYWSYEFNDLKDVVFDSYMVPTKDLKLGDLRLLEVDNRIVVPYMSDIRMLVTASDVIHAWTIPSLCVKADAIPGRLNQINFTVTRPGVFYGQCSEICGANHSFMPIVLESVKLSAFLK